MEHDPIRSRRWTTDPRPRYWWHRLPGMDFVPPIYSNLSDEEWGVIREWFEETDQSGQIGECVVPLMSFLHGLIMGNRADRIVQLGTCSGYSTLLIGFMMRRMEARHGLFTLDRDPEMAATSQRWLNRAGLEPFVRIEMMDSMNQAAPAAAAQYLEGAPGLIIVDSSHEYAATLTELDLWYPFLAPGGLICLHDTSRFAEDFDVTHDGGVRRAFTEWRGAHPDVEAILLNGESRTMEGRRPLYKDACGLGILHKPTMPDPGS
jgi:predicted O-methyltransferase YrrM